ncbi:MAG: AMP-binding protein, partial [Acidobacteriota bacterium]|nr:AMP-binding protein [Acidobacteriota bacterium]
MMDSVPTDRRSRDPSAAVPSSVPTLTAALRRAAGGEQRGVSVLDRTEAASRRTWAEIHANSRVVASGLHRLGIESGSRVALIYPTGFEFIEAFFGCLLAGAVPVPMYPPVRLGRLSEYHRRTAAMFDAVSGSLMLCDSRIRRLLGETVVQVRPPLGCRTLAELPAGSQSATATDEHDLCLIQFSSGTTVDPKPVALTHRAVMSQITALNGFWPDSQAVRHSGVSWLPLYHDMGLIGCLCAAVERPGDLMLIPPELFIAQPAVWLRTLSRTRATISPSPN